LFSNLKLHGKEEQDTLGRVYEYCLSMFAEAEGKRGGEFYTPACVVRTLVEVMRPYQGRVYRSLSAAAQSSFSKPTVAVMLLSMRSSEQV